MRYRRFSIVIAALACVIPITALAADHLDSPTAMADPTADITDLYAWSENDGRVRLVLDVSPFATETSRFSTATQYAFHVESSAMFGTPGEQRSVVCQAYDTSNGMECWVLDDEGTVLDWVGGDASVTAGITSPSGDVRLFAGLRDDPFFFNLAGFNNTRALVQGAGPALVLDPAGCPTLDAATSSVIVQQLRTDPTSTPPGGPARDGYAGANVLAIVLEVDAALLSPGGPILSVWASTHGAP